MDWISVEDRLPEDDRFYLCFGAGDANYMVARWVGDVWFSDDMRGYEFSHWIPLPDPPTIKP